jgi:hypothetical protein
VCRRVGVGLKVLCAQPTALTDARIEDLGQDFIVAGGWDRVIIFELDFPAEFCDERDGLSFGN